MSKNTQATKNSESEVVIIIQMKNLILIENQLQATKKTIKSIRYGNNTYAHNEWQWRIFSHSLPNIPTNNSIKSNNLILSPVNSKYENRRKYIKQYKTQSNNSSATFLTDTNKNRKKLPNYIKDKNYGVSTKLQNDNFISQQKLNNLKNNYNEIKILLYVIYPKNWNKINKCNSIT